MKFNRQFFSFFASTRTINTCLLSLSCIAIVLPQQVNAERWFEVEVILFKQLADKNSLKEQFPTQTNSSNLPQYRRDFDLLTSYLQPDLTAIKQLMPLCSDPQGESQLSLAHNKPMLALPEQTRFIEQANNISYTPQEVSSSLTAQTTDSTIDNTSEGLTTQTKQSSLNDTQAVSEDKTAEDIQEDMHQATELVFHWQTEALNSALYSPKVLCVYRQTDFEQLLDKDSLAKFNLDAFKVTALPKRLNAPGAHQSNSPYLIADDSLLLKDINTRLRWSKEFKPLLHFGWRQVGITRKKAIPLKLFAGQHLANDYQQAVADYEIQLEEARQQEQARFELQQSTLESQKSDEQDNVTNQQAMKAYYAKLKQQSLTQLFTEISNIKTSDSESDVIDETIQQLTQQDLDSLLSSVEIDTDITEQPLDIANPPTEPLQPWFLDGFFKIHLDHYLYINADFNLLSERILESSVGSLDEGAMNLINFSQNRRVITGEIHYFDHPYIGMVVQIRRFDPSKPADEAVSQAIK